MRPQHSLDEARDRAALYALGALRGDEAREFAAHLQSGCAICAAEVETFSAVAADLARSVPAEAPGAAVRARVLERIAGGSREADQLVIEKGGLRFVRTARVDWEATGTGAIEIKRLFRDAQRAYSTQLVRMTPGTTYPSHRHSDVEELYLLEGDLLVSGVLMRAGDYCRAEPGTVHSDISTPSGCLFISMASERDELLA